MKSPFASKLLVLAGLAIAGCSSSSEGATPAEDAVADTSAEAAPDANDSTVSDAPAESAPDAPSTCDGAVPGPGDGGACHSLVFTAPEVSITAVTSLPTMTGGAIALGTYDAIEAKTTGTLTGAYRAAWRFSDCALDIYEYVTTGGTPPTPTPRTLSWATAATTLTRTQVCGGTTTFTNDYTARTDATGTYLDVRSGQLMFTFKKR
jgi:hypothetical protein